MNKERDIGGISNGRDKQGSMGGEIEERIKIRGRVREGDRKEE